MADLISRAEAVRIIADMHGLCRDDVLRESIQAIKELPAVDAVPVVHSRWDEIRDYSQAGLISFECLECGRLCDTLYKYCPHCGAKMDGERRDDDADN